MNGQNENETHGQSRAAVPVGDYLLQRRQWRRRVQRGQSALMAIIVLFLLLFLAGIFIAILVGNIRNVQRAEITSTSQRFAEAGIKYLDEQLSNSPEGADWRSAPSCSLTMLGIAALPGAQQVNYLPCSDQNISEADPDYYWLKPYDDRQFLPRGQANPDYGTGGFTRVNFGSEVPGSRNTGGRALVRVTYAPRVDPTNPDVLSRYIKLESIGRSGQIIPSDPTTYGNSNALGQRVELLAYKGIGLNEYVRQVINKDNKPVTVSLGAVSAIQDVDYTQNPPVLRPRNIESIFTGPIRVNANLTFYGVNRLTFNPLLNEGLEVAGLINLNSVPDTVDRTTYDNLVTSNQAPTRVYVSTTGLGATDLSNITILPSNSPNFSTLAPALETSTGRGGVALVRDNPRGGETALLNADKSAPTAFNEYQNLRTVGRTEPPLMDAPTGANGLTRYRALTRNAAPLSQKYVANNAINAGLINNNSAGFYGWGEGLYLANTQDMQSESNNLLGGYSLRSDWMSAGAAPTGNRRASWRGDVEYVPPAVSITLNPAYMSLEAFQEDVNRQSFYFRDEQGQRITGIRMIRYTLPTKPTAGLDPAVPTKQGYPATKDGPNGIAGDGDDTAYYQGDYVIFAEGNIRIRGVVGGKDPESGEYFKRHLTVVSNATIYIDGNLLRDNIDAADTDARATAVRGNSSIALLAKNYVAVNTTQFLGPEQRDINTEADANSQTPPSYRLIDSKKPQFPMHMSFGPVRDANGNLTSPSYLTRNPAAGEGATGVASPQFFLRHSTADGNAATAVNYFINPTTQFRPTELLSMPPLYSAPNDPTVLLLNVANRSNNPNDNPTPVFVDDVFAITPNYTAPTNTSLLLGTPIAAQNNLIVNLDVSYPNTGAAYKLSRVGVAPLDIRVEALIYAQEGAFFIIPGPSFNPNPNDTFDFFKQNGHRADEVSTTQDARPRINHLFPFYNQPMDIRMTFFGEITENLPAEIGDESAWLEKWGWVPSAYGSTGLQAYSSTLAPSLPQPPATQLTVHGPLATAANGGQPGGVNGNGLGNGIEYKFDDRARYPYADLYDPADPTRTRLNPNPVVPLRVNPYNSSQPLPIVPRLPVAPGLLYYGQNRVTR